MVTNVPVSINPTTCVDIERGQVWGDIFHDQSIYEQELKNVFARSWALLAHDSMIPNAGDFIQNYIGEDPVVVVRQKDGSVAAFLNQCRHRGMRLCRADLGNAKAFMCSFHGWVFDGAGDLVEVPHEKTSYPDGIDKSKLNAIKVSRIEYYKGFWFGNWDESAPSFLEYLGDMAFYFDSYIDRYDGGMEVTAVHKWVIPCNWKFNMEQPSSDLAHGEFTHLSAMTVFGARADELAAKGEGPALGIPLDSDPTIGRFGGMSTGQYSDPMGHGCGFTYGRPLGAQGTWALWEAENKRDEVVRRLGEERAQGVRGHLNLFPNLMLLTIGVLRFSHPRGPNEMEMWGYTMVPKDAPPEVKDAIRKDVARMFSPGGVLEQDDAENWLEEQRILRGHVARQHPLSYQAWLGREEPNPHGSTGTFIPSDYSEVGARGAYQHWADMMTGDSWAEILERKQRRLETNGGLSVGGAG